MGIKYSFVDSEVYGTEDVNSITSSLVGAGIAPFLSADSYNVSDLNSLTSAIVEPGVELGGCKCTGVYTDSVLIGVDVAQGIIYFESGVRLVVDKEGESVPVEKDTAGFVYAYFSPSLQFAKIEFGASLPTDGEYVLLARVDKEGRVWDERVFAHSKIATLGSNLIIEKEFENIEPIPFDEPDDSHNWYKVAEISGVNLSQHSYIMVSKVGSNFDSFAFYDIKNDCVLVSKAERTKVLGQSGRLDTSAEDINYYFRVFEGKPSIVATCDRAGYEKYLPAPPFDARIM